ncbi:ribonuclease III [Malacoplasma penetrans]|nr:ribonuclease III [Malacoplasma penetrans]
MKKIMKDNNYRQLDVTKILNKLGIKTNKYYLYVEALTHNSYNNEKKVDYTYQRLEFLGDAVISKLISEFLFKNKSLDEQKMTEIRKNLVNSEIFKKASEELGLLDYAFIGKGINLENDTKKIKADLFEAFAGAIFIDKGEDEVWKYLEKTILKYYENNELVNPIDYKSRIQELFQYNIAKKHKKAHFYYQTVEIENNMFKSSLIYDEIIYGVGVGKTKKEAQKSAAKIAYEKYAFDKNMLKKSK